MFELGFSNHPALLKPENKRAWNLTYSLVFFTQSHNYNAYRNQLKDCLSAIEDNERETAKTIAQNIPIGGNGCFNDVFIEPLGAHEDEVTAQTCFEAIVTCWRIELVGDQSRTYA